MNKKFDIFISYRRKGGGFETANIIHDRLTQAGYKVFMDVENLRSGKFNEQLYRQIDNCKDFIVVLGPDSLERCKNADDWVRLEVARAISADKNIIPVFLRNFTQPTEPLPADIAELLNYEGIEASQEFFNAFLLRLRKMLYSKRYFTWNRIRKQLLFIIIPLIILSGTLLFIHHYNKQKEQAQLEQVCKQVVSEIAFGFGNSNTLLSTLEDTRSEWKKFYFDYIKSNDIVYKERLKNQLNQFLDFKLKQIADTTKIPDIKLTSAHEELLARNSISTEDIKAAKFMFISNIEQTQDYLLKIKYWLSTPNMSWPLELNESMDILAEFNKEMINAGIFSFNELILEMPISSRDVYIKFSPNLTKFTSEMNFTTTKSELESKELTSFKRCEELLAKYSVIIGDENRIVSWMSNQLDSLKNKKKDQAIALTNPKLDSMKKVVAVKKEELKQKRVEVDSKKELILESYQRILSKCTFDKSEDPGMMWGKIIHLAQFGYTQILAENNCKAETERLKEEAIKSGQNPNAINPITVTINAIEVFQEVQNRLDLYLAYNKNDDQNALKYIPAAKSYYKQVSERKLEPIGILMIGTDNNVVHPNLRIGDIVIERKGKTVDRVETYAKLKEDPATNVLKVIRFVNGKKTILTETISPDCKVLVGMMNLWEEK